MQYIEEYQYCNEPNWIHHSFVLTFNITSMLIFLGFMAYPSPFSDFIVFKCVIGPIKLIFGTLFAPFIKIFSFISSHSPHNECNEHTDSNLVVQERNNDNTTSQITDSQIHERNIHNTISRTQEDDDFRKHYVKLDVIIYYKVDMMFEICPICLNCRVNCVTECGHYFHIGCISKSLRVRRSCPICRRRI